MNLKHFCWNNLLHETDDSKDKKNDQVYVDTFNWYYFFIYLYQN